MNASKSVPQRLGRVLEAVTRQSDRLAATPEYGSWLLGKVSESQQRRRVRIQVILTAFVVVANLIGIAVASLVVTVAFPIPSVFEPEVRWITFAVVPAYIAAALVIGVFWATRRVINNVRWAIEQRTPSRTDQRNTFFAPWRLTRVLLVLWGVGTALITTLYALVDTNYIPKVLLGISFSGIVVSACCYLFTEFALRPVAAQALEAGPPPHRFAQGIMGRTMLVWALGSGVPVLGILLAAVITLSLRNVTPTQFIIAIMILALFALVFGFLLMLLLSWLTATPVRVVRSALKHVEEGDLDRNVVVFDGTELGELQRGFNAMAHGLVNKFEGDAALAVFGAPVTLEHPEDEALACARSIAERLSNEVPGCQAGIGVAAGQVVAGNVGGKERFEYTVIGGRSTRPPGCASWPSLRPADLSPHRTRWRTRPKAKVPIGL